MNKIIILGHDNLDVDSVISGYLLEKYLKNKNIDCEFIIHEDLDDTTKKILDNNNFNYLKFRKELKDKPDNLYILTDHNERKVLGKIIGVFDHHKRDKKLNIKYYYNRNISSASLMILKLNEKIFSKEDYYLAFLASFVDTISFHSSKSRFIDKKYIINKVKDYNFNYHNLYKEGLLLTDTGDINKAYINGLKEYIINDKKIEASYLQIENIDEVIINNCINLIKERIKDKKLDLFVLIVFDMKKFNTTVYLIKRDNITTKNYNYIASRGNRIIVDIKNKYKWE